MTKQDFIDAHKHEIAGFVMDAMTHKRGGGEAALFARQIMSRIDARLGAIYDDFQPKPQPPATAGAQNGQSTTQTQRQTPQSPQAGAKSVAGSQQNPSGSPGQKPRT